MLGGKRKQDADIKSAPFLLSLGNSNALRTCGNAIRQPHIAPPLAFIDAQHDGCLAGKMIDRMVEEHKARSELRYLNLVTV